MVLSDKDKDKKKTNKRQRQSRGDTGIGQVPHGQCDCAGWGDDLAQLQGAPARK